MRWGRKKVASSSSSSSTSNDRASFVSRVLPASWISKFKTVSESKARKVDEKKESLKHTSVPLNSLNSPKFDKTDSFWRLSFGEENHNVKGVLRSPPHHSHNKTDLFNSGEANPIPRIKLRRDTEVSPEINGGEVVLIKTPRINTMQKPKERNSDMKKSKTKTPAAGLDLEEISKSEQQRKSVYGRRTSRPKVRVFSPRLEACRLKAVEDMKMKLKKAEEEEKLENFAVVKCSFDPRQDFRESMIEMIIENRISRAEELEKLLACYLTLNSDEYHDMIIKVFRQVWFDMKQALSDAPK